MVYDKYWLQDEPDYGHNHLLKSIWEICSDVMHSGQLIVKEETFLHHVLTRQYFTLSSSCHLICHSKAFKPITSVLPGLDNHRWYKQIIQRETLMCCAAEPLKYPHRTFICFIVWPHRLTLDVDSICCRYARWSGSTDGIVGLSSIISHRLPDG